ncbi:hypothetical protein ACFL4R_01250 [Nitrospirota bacterium]
MGLLDKLLGKGKDYPPLDESAPAFAQLDGVRENLAKLASDINDNMEIVPADQAAYVYFGKPPKMFGISWIHEGRIVNVKTLVDEKGFSPSALQHLTELLKGAYEDHQNEDRFSYGLGEKKVTVIPSAGLASDVGRIIEKISQI